MEGNKEGKVGIMGRRGRRTVVVARLALSPLPFPPPVGSAEPPVSLGEGVFSTVPVVLEGTPPPPVLLGTFAMKLCI